MYLLSSDFRAIASSFCWLDYSTLLFNCPYCRKFLFKLPSTINSREKKDVLCIGQLSDLPNKWSPSQSKRPLPFNQTFSHCACKSRSRGAKTPVNSTPALRARLEKGNWFWWMCHLLWKIIEIADGAGIPQPSIQQLPLQIYNTCYMNIYIYSVWMTSCNVKYIIYRNINASAFSCFLWNVRTRTTLKKLNTWQSL